MILERRKEGCAKNAGLYSFCPPCSAQQPALALRENFFLKRKFQLHSSCGLEAGIFEPGLGNFSSCAVGLKKLRHTCGTEMSLPHRIHTFCGRQGAQND